MRGAGLIVAMLAAACGADSTDPTTARAYRFGPYTLSPAEEISRDCVQITLDNDDYLHINSVALTTGAGFHHSNWFHVPEHVFAGDDGTYHCEDRDFNEPVAAIFGGVIFAQSTQAPHEVQKFPPGVVVTVPPRSKLVGQIHLLNPTDDAIELAPEIELTPIAETDVTTRLAGISFQNQALALPPQMQSRFTVECDLGERHRYILGRDPDFKIYYALAHYHELGTKLVVEGVSAAGVPRTIYTTENNVGDVLGGVIDPVFDMTGLTKLRLSCEFYNPRPRTVGWGLGDQEMCIFLAFSDSPYNWGGGVNDITPPENPLQIGNMMTFTNGCAVYANDASR